MSGFAHTRVVVTGAAGFIGRHLVTRLVHEGAEVHALVRSSKVSEIEKVHGKAVVARAVDITDADALRACIEDIAPQGVFHLAAVSQSYGNVPSLHDLVSVNIEATLSLMDICKSLDLSFFVNTDTFAVARAGTDSHAVAEDDAYEPAEFYSISRIPATLYAKTLGEKQGKPYVTLRVFTPYGPWVQKGKIHYTLITQALTNAPISLSGKEVTRDFIYIDDLVDLYLVAAQHARQYPGAIFNAGTGKATTLGELAEVVLAASHSSSTVEYTGSTASYDTARWEADMSKVERLLGWKPTVPLANGVEKTVAWFQEHEDYWRAV